nr:MAG TPA: hypothetical protein [Caudoviricetes sp.]
MKFFCNFVSIKNFKIQILYLNLKVLLSYMLIINAI